LIHCVVVGEVGHIALRWKSQAIAALKCPEVGEVDIAIMVQVGRAHLAFIRDAVQVVVQAAQNRIAADFDNDGDVDLVDFSVLQRCYSGQTGSPAPNCSQ
jgi:hypothetical protein